MRVKQKWIPQEKRMGRGGKETLQRFPLAAAKRKQNTCFLALSFPVLGIFAQL